MRIRTTTNNNNFIPNKEKNTIESRLKRVVSIRKNLNSKYCQGLGGRIFLHQIQRLLKIEDKIFDEYSNVTISPNLRSRCVRV